MWAIGVSILGTFPVGNVPKMLTKICNIFFVYFVLQNTIESEKLLSIAIVAADQIHNMQCLHLAVRDQPIG